MKVYVLTRKRDGDQTVMGVYLDIHKASDRKARNDRLNRKHGLDHITEITTYTVDPRAEQPAKLGKIYFYPQTLQWIHEDIYNEQTDNVAGIGLEIKPANNPT